MDYYSQYAQSQEDDTWENQLCLFTMPSLLLVA